MTFPAQKSSPSPVGSPWRLPQLRHRVAIPMVAVLLVATVGKILVLSPGLTHGETAVVEGLSQHRNATADALSLTIHTGLSTVGTVLIIAGITGWLAVLRRRPLDGAAFLVTSLMGWALVAAMQVHVARPQPVLRSVTPLGSAHEIGTFPSGPVGAAMAMVLAVTAVNFSASYRHRLFFCGLAVVGLVGASQVYAGVTYPMDVIMALPVAWAGVMMGCAVCNTLVPALAYGFGWTQPGCIIDHPRAQPQAGQRPAPRTGGPRVKTRSYPAEHRTADSAAGDRAA